LIIFDQGFNGPANQDAKPKLTNGFAAALSRSAGVSPGVSPGVCGGIGHSPARRRRSQAYL